MTPQRARRSLKRFEYPDMLTVQQLNHAQWHVIDPAGHWDGGVTGWVEAVAHALWAAIFTETGVESVSLDGDRLVLLYPGATR